MYTPGTMLDSFESERKARFITAFSVGGRQRWMSLDHPLELFGALRRTRLENDNNTVKAVEKIEAVVVDRKDELFSCRRYSTSSTFFARAFTRLFSSSWIIDDASGRILFLHRLIYSSFQCLINCHIQYQHENSEKSEKTPAPGFIIDILNYQRVRQRRISS